MLRTRSVDNTYIATICLTPHFIFRNTLKTESSIVKKHHAVYEAAIKSGILDLFSRRRNHTSQPLLLVTSMW